MKTKLYVTQKDYDLYLSIAGKKWVQDNCVIVVAKETWFSKCKAKLGW